MTVLLLPSLPSHPRLSTTTPLGCHCKWAAAPSAGWHVAISQLTLLEEILLSLLLALLLLVLCCLEVAVRELVQAQRWQLNLGSHSRGSRSSTSQQELADVPAYGTLESLAGTAR
jgi:hypothetical protein